MSELDLMKSIEAYILETWLETGNEPSIEALIEKFGVTFADIEPLVMDDDEGD